MAMGWFGRIAPADSGRVGAWATSLGAIFALPAALLACLQAWSAKDSARDARAALDLAQRQVAIADGRLALARAELNESRALVHENRSLVLAAQRQAGYAGDFANSARGQAEQAVLGVSETRRIADISQKRMEREQALLAQGAEPRLRFKEFDLLHDLEIGKEPQANVAFTAKGDIEPIGLKSWVGWQIVSEDTVNLSVPACTGEAPGWDKVGALRTGSMTIRRPNLPITAAEAKRLNAGQTLYSYGALCYLDSHKAMHRTNWCVFLNPRTGRWAICNGTAEDY